MYKLSQDEVIKKYKAIANLDERYDEVFSLYDDDILKDEFDSYIRYQILQKRLTNKELSRIYKVIDPKCKDKFDNKNLKYLIGLWIGIDKKKVDEYMNLICI